MKTSLAVIGLMMSAGLAMAQATTASDAEKAKATAEKAQATVDKAKATVDKQKATVEKAQATVDQEKANVEKAQATVDKAKAAATGAQAPPAAPEKPKETPKAPEVPKAAPPAPPAGAPPAPAAPPAAQAMPAPPKPSAEHDVLKNDVGTWDATVEMPAAPGQPASTTKGVETNTLVGGLWLVTDFKGEMMGAPFMGHGVSGWDPAKKKYVYTWVDTSMTSIGLGDGTYDPATKTISGTFEAPDPTGAVQKMKSSTVYADPDTRVFTMSGTGPDGKDTPMMKITYKRRK